MILLRPLVLAQLTLLAIPALADNFSFTGVFSADDQVQLFGLALSAPGDITLITYGYAGGTNAASASISRGGFDPIVSLFSGFGPSAAFLNTNNDGGPGLVGQDSVTLAYWDSYLQLLALPAGFYTIALTESDNTPAGSFLSDGFGRDGQGNFTGPAFLGGPGSFVDANPNQRTSAYALDILTTSPAVITPEPATWTLLGTGLAVALIGRRRSSRS